MKRQLLSFALIVCTLPLVAQAQSVSGWDYLGPFPADSSVTFSVQGLAVGSNGRVFIQNPAGGDVVVFERDGTLVDTINTVTVGSDVDTLAYGRGLESDIDGNILIVTSDNVMYRVNAETLEGMDKVDLTYVPAGPEISGDGSIFVGPVVNGNPIEIYANDFSFVANAIEETPGIARHLAVTEDGNTIYYAPFPDKIIYKYSRPDEFSNFALVDSLYEGVVSESQERNPLTGNIWFSNGSPFGGAQADTLSDETWYAFNPLADRVLVDSIKWDTTAGINNETPRGMAFTADGDTAYVAMFDADSGAPSVQKFARTGTVGDAIDAPAGIPENLTLSDNYPNPFTESTQISFGLHKTGKVTLKVYDVLGREVRTLVDRVVPLGDNHTVTFEAQSLPAGVYFYQLRTEGHQLSGKMLLVK